MQDGCAWSIAPQIMQHWQHPMPRPLNQCMQSCSMYFSDCSQLHHLSWMLFPDMLLHTADMHCAGARCCRASLIGLSRCLLALRLPVLIQRLLE